MTFRDDDVKAAWIDFASYFRAAFHNPIARAKLDNDNAQACRRSFHVLEELMQGALAVVAAPVPNGDDAERTTLADTAATPADVPDPCNDTAPGEDVPVRPWFDASEEEPMPSSRHWQDRVNRTMRQSQLAQRQPLTGDHIVFNGLMMATDSAQDAAKWFEQGVRFAEREHGIGTSGTTQAPGN